MNKISYVKTVKGRKVPTYIEGYGEVIPYTEEDRSIEIHTKASMKIFTSNKNIINKVTESIAEALIQCDLKDGMTLSFHHHLRDGDYVLMMVLEEIKKLGIKNIKIESSSLSKAHEGLTEYIKEGIVTGIGTSGMRGKLAKEISYNNILGKPVVFRTHGGRARAIEMGEITIDIVIIATSSCDKMGNMNSRYGKSAFGSMGYPLVDAKYAKKVIAITDNLVEYPLTEPSIDQTLVDNVVLVGEIGDNSKIASGATRVTEDERDLLIASYVAEVLKESGYVKEGFSFQAGSGGASLAVIKYLKQYMIEKNIKGSFASGGVTAVLVDLLEEGLFKTLIDTQTFDVKAVDSLNKNKRHIEMSASMYANPYNKGAVVNLLDIMVLSATEIDVDFNVNVITGSTGVIMGAQGGHPDTAEGAKLRIVTAPITRKDMPIIIESVTTVVTPGNNIDIVVTDRGIAINPKRKDLIDRLNKTSLPIVTIEELKEEAEKTTGRQKKPIYGETIVGVIEARDGRVIDVIRQVIQ